MGNPSFAGRDLRQFWRLDPDITFLNHGSFGACPIGVLDYQQSLRDRLERQPLKFLSRDLEALLDAARVDLAAFVGASPADLVFVPNATTGVNAVLRSLRFGPGDELLTTDQEYNACRNALEFVAARSGATVVVAPLPWPIEDPKQVVAAVLAAVTPRTRLLMMDHVVSQTGLVMPIGEIINALPDGIDTLIDGAHAPGMVPLDLQTLGATYYASTCHKWICAPKGAGFLYVQADRQAQVRPLTISHGANDPRTDRSRFHLEFDWMGTNDPTAYLAVPQALQFMGSLLPGGWPALMDHNRDRALAARRLLCERLGVAAPGPESMVGSLAAIPLPDGDAVALGKALWEQAQIEVPIIPFPAPRGRLLRISAQIYNDPAQYDYLATTIEGMLALGL
jgi:isopenicillin-N epimerase